jgi:cell division septation protein DedD
MAIRQAEAGRAGDLTALDRVPAPAPPAPAKSDITFYDQLPKGRPAVPPPADPAKPVPPAPRPQPTAEMPAPAPQVAAVPTPPATPTAATAPTPAAVATPVSVSPGPVGGQPATPSGAAVRPAPAAKGNGGAWCVQLAAVRDRAEAERIAAKWKSASPRIESADVPGKGRYFRVRVGSFETKEVAERYLRDFSRETGAKGFVTATR